MTSPRLFTGRRLIVFLMLTTGGLAAGVTANGLATVNENLPEAFTPAQPLPGDEAEWSFLRVADGPTENALPVFRLQRLPDGYTWNSMGKPVLAEFIRTQGAQWHEANGEQVYSWSVPLTDAGAHGQTFWFERDDGFSAASEAQASNSERVDVGRSYLAASGGYIQFDCLRTTLPDSFALQESFKLERGCLFSWPFADPEGVLTESELQAKYDGIGGLALSKDQKLRAIGSSDTAYGPAVVVKAEFEAAHAQWELLLWYVESVPYPVQASVKLTDQHVVFGLSSFTRGSPEQPPAPSLAPLPPVRDAPLRPWGPDDAGVDLPLLPSEAWQVAVGDPNGGVRDFLERHPDA